MKLKLLIVFCLTIAGFLFLTINNSTKVSAATCTWNGSADTAWSNATNWSGGCSGVGGIPGNTDDLVFPNSGGNKTSVNDLVLNINSIFLDGAYTFSGNPIAITTGITTINSPVTLSINIQTAATTQTWDIDPAGIIVSGNVALNGNLDFVGGVTQIDGDISGTGNINVDVTGNVVLTGTNSFIGSIDINGVLGLNSIGATGNAGNAITVGDTIVLASLVSNVNGGVTSGSNVVVNDTSVWDLNGFDESIGSLSGNGNVLIPSGSNLTVGTGNASLSSANLFTSIGSITKTGTGTATFNGNNPTFAGSMIINQGTAVVNGDFQNTDATVNSGSVLSGTGRLGSIAGTGGSISVGDGTGGSTGLFFVANNVTLNSSFTYIQDINGPTSITDYDTFNSNGIIDIGGATLSINLGYSAPAGDSFTILESSAGITGTFNGLPDGSIIIAGGRPFQIRYLGTTVELSVPSIGLSNPTFISDPATPTANQPFTITSFWLGLGPTATGTAELFNGSTSLGTVSLVGGVATFNVAGLPEGTYILTVQYSGDLNFSARTSDPLDLTVAAAALPNTGISLPIELMAVGLFLSLGGIVVVKKKS